MAASKTASNVKANTRASAAASKTARNVKANTRASDAAAGVTPHTSTELRPTSSIETDRRCDAKSGGNDNEQEATDRQSQKRKAADTKLKQAAKRGKG